MYFQPETLKEMLIRFRQNNEANHITGMMLFSEGAFLQVLEGEDGKVDALIKKIKKIKKDRRHHSLVQIAAGSITERMFGNWSMSFKAISPETSKDLKGYINPWDPDVFNGFANRAASRPGYPENFRPKYKNDITCNCRAYSKTCTTP